MIYVSHLLEDEEMKEVLHKSGAGVESIEFAISENLDSLEQKMVKYRKRLEDMGCRELLLHGPFLDLNPMTFDSLVMEATIKRYEQSYQAARELGAKKLVFHTCYVPDVYLLIGWAERTAEFYKRFLEGKEGIQIVMENVFDREPEPILEAARLVGHPDFRLCLDIGHAHCYSPVPVTKWAELFGEQIGHLHIHDNYGDRDSHQGLGSGDVPFKEVLDIVRRNCPDVTMTVECSRKEDVLLSLEEVEVL